MSKKSRKAKAPVVVEESPRKLVAIADTTFLGLSKILWEDIYALLEAEDPMEIEEEATLDGTNKTESMLNDLASSIFHKITAQAKVLPYNDLVRWVIKSTNIMDRDFLIADGRMFGTFKSEDVKKMYHLSDP